MKQLHCKRCGHDWFPQKFDRNTGQAVKPQVCPKCKSYNWEKAPKPEKE